MFSQLKRLSWLSKKTCMKSLRGWSNVLFDPALSVDHLTDLLVWFDGFYCGQVYSLCYLTNSRWAVNRLPASCTGSTKSLLRSCVIHAPRAHPLRLWATMLKNARAFLKNYTTKGGCPWRPWSVREISDHRVRTQGGYNSLPASLKETEVVVLILGNLDKHSVEETGITLAIRWMIKACTKGSARFFSIPSWHHIFLIISPPE